MITEMNINKPLLIFDLDGTLYQVDRAWVPAVQQMLAAWGGPKLPAEVFRSRIGQPAAHMIAWYQELLPHADMDAFLQELRHRTQENMASGEFLYPGCRELLQGLAETAGAMVICSNGVRSYVEQVLTRHGIAGFFSAVFTPEDGFMSKDECLAHILKIHRFRPAMMVGDRVIDISAAKTNQILSIGALYGYGSGDEVHQADVCIRSLSELPEAVFRLTHTPGATLQSVSIGCCIHVCSCRYLSGRGPIFSWRQCGTA